MHCQQFSEIACLPDISTNDFTSDIACLFVCLLPSLLVYS